MKFDRQLQPATETSWVVSYDGKTIPRWLTVAILKIDTGYITISDKAEWWLISATLCGWKRCFVADQLWFMTCIREEEEVKNHLIFMKFCTQQQILNWMNVTWSKMKKLHWIDFEFDRTYFLYNIFSLNRGRYCASLQLRSRALRDNAVALAELELTEHIYCYYYYYYYY